MDKKRVNITLDPELHSEAKELGLNISGVSERALRQYVQALTSGEEVVLSSSPSDSPIDDDREQQASEPAQEYADASVDEIIADYEQYGKTVLNRSQSTLDQHTRYVGRLLRHAEKPPAAIREMDIIAYIESEQPISDAKHKNILSAVRVFFREFVDSEAASSFEIPNISPNPTSVPTKDELQTFYEAIDTHRYRAVFLMYATSGLRSAELVQLTMDDIDEEDRMLIPDKESESKQTWVSFYNEEAEAAFAAYKPHREPGDDRLLQLSKPAVLNMFQKISEESGVKITPQVLRRWFASEMASLGVDSSYIDAFAGRVPASVLEKHYLDYSPRKLKQIYEDAGITVLESATND